MNNKGKILGIYNANGGFFGEASYLLGKISGNCHCSLCDITHGKFSAKKEWLELAENFPIDIETIHINEMSEDVKDFVGNSTPCVIFIDEQNRFFNLLNADDLSKCDKSPKIFFDTLEEKLTQINIERKIDQDS